MTDYAAPLFMDEIREHLLTTVDPHPDGKPWAKCCGDNYNTTCAMRRSPAYDMNGTPQTRVSCCHGARSKPDLGGQRWFCVHRRDNGFHRICAGWNAVYGEKKKGVDDPNYRKVRT